MSQSCAVCPRPNSPAPQTFSKPCLNRLNPSRPRSVDGWRFSHTRRRPIGRPALTASARSQLGMFLPKIFVFRKTQAMTNIDDCEVTIRTCHLPEGVGRSCGEREERLSRNVDCGTARRPNAMYETCPARLARAGGEYPGGGVCHGLPTDRRAGSDRFAAVLDVRHRADAR